MRRRVSPPCCPCTRCRRRTACATRRARAQVIGRVAGRVDTDSGPSPVCRPSPVRERLSSAASGSRIGHGYLAEAAPGQRAGIAGAPDTWSLCACETSTSAGPRAPRRRAHRGAWRGRHRHQSSTGSRSADQVGPVPVAGQRARIGRVQERRIHPARSTVGGRGLQLAAPARIADRRTTPTEANIITPPRSGTASSCQRVEQDTRPHAGPTTRPRLASDEARPSMPPLIVRVGKPRHHRRQRRAVEAHPDGQHANGAQQGRARSRRTGPGRCRARSRRSRAESAAPRRRRFTTRPTSMPCTSASDRADEREQNPIVDAVKPKRASLKSANVASNPENASVTMK